MTRAEIQDYWLNHHGPLFKKFADNYRAVRYVQSHTIDSPPSLSRIHINVYVNPC
ncbi:MAG: EthD domain-containing protein [Proteobacteria bacterium]|nr:EthD domain-containing protein [Pseudomonadota bacterium]